MGNFLLIEPPILIEIAGWLGVIFYILAYFLLSVGVLKSDGYLFHALNILGAIGLIADSAYQMDMPNLVVNLVWLIVGIFAMAKRFFLLKQQHRSIN